MPKTTKITAKNTAQLKAKTKANHVLGMLSRSTGASIADMMKSTNWQAHSVRGFLAGSLKKKGMSCRANWIKVVCAATG